MSSIPESKTRLDHEQGIAFKNPFAATDNGSTHQDVQPYAHLNVPLARNIPRRRSSIESLFSDLSELNIMSNDIAARPLMRTASNASQHSAYSNAGRRTLRHILRELYYENYGALLVLLSQVFGSAMNVSATLLEKDGAHGKGMHPFQILFVRQSLTALFCTVWALASKSIPDFPFGPSNRSVRLLLICRGLFGFFGVFGMYFSLIYLPLSEATVLTFLAPILTCYVCSKVLPGETFTRQQFMAGLVSLVGVIFIAHPVTLFSKSASTASSIPPVAVDAGAGPLPTNTTSTFAPEHTGSHPTPSQHLFAIAIAMLGVCGATGAMVSIRAIGTRAHAFISINYFSVWSSIVSLIAILVIPGVSFRLPSNLIEWALLFNLGICGFVLQALLTMGLSYGGPSSDSKDNNKSGDLNSGSVTSTKTSITNQNHGMESIPEGQYEGDIEMQTHPRTRPQSQTQTQTQVTRVRRRSSASHSTAPAESSSSSSSSSFPQAVSELQASADTKLMIGSPAVTAAFQSEAQTSSKQPPRPNRKSPSGNKATSMVYCQMLFALTADKIIFGTTLGVWSWIGSGLILAGAVWVAAAREGGAKKTAAMPTSVSPGTDPDSSAGPAETRMETITEQRTTGSSAGATDSDISSDQQNVSSAGHESASRFGFGVADLADRGLGPDTRPSIRTRAEERMGLLSHDDEHSEHD